MKRARAQPLRNTVPTANLRVLLEIVAEAGIAPADALQGTPLTLQMLESPDLRVDTRDAAQTVINAYRLSRNEGLGLEFGLRSRPTTHGPVGYAALSCSTFHEAMDLVCRYIHLRQPHASLSLSVTPEHLVLGATQTQDLGPTRDFVFEALLVGLYKMSGFLLGEDPACELWLDWPEPAYFARYRDRLPQLHYGKPLAQLRFPVRYAARRLVMADVEAVRRAVAECEREMTLLGGAPENLRERVRAELRPGPRGYPSLEQVARRLCMSDRSLKRKLETAGTSFQLLLDEVRYQEAQRLLQNPELDIQQIAVALGYTDPPSFTRAFRRWSGRTPSAARSGGGAASKA